MFLLIFLLIYGAMNFYAVSRTLVFLGVKKKALVYLLWIPFAASFLIANMLERRYGNFPSRLFYFLAATWFGVVFVHIWVLLICEVVKLATKIPARKIIIGGLAATALLGLIGHVNALFIRTRIRRIHSPRIRKPLRVCHISDLHSSPLLGAVHLKKVAAMIRPLEPDVVFITGDLLDGPYVYDKEDFRALDDLGVPVFFSYGNHERYTGDEAVKAALSGTKIRTLRDESDFFGDVQVIGIDDSDDASYMMKKLDELEIDREKYVILMYHRPDGENYAAKKGVDLMLAGHTHAGQIAPFNLIVWFVHRPLSGLHRRGEMILNVSTGTGTWGPRMRLGSSSEIVLLELTPEGV